MYNNIKIALAQMQTGTDIKENLQQIEEYAKQAASENVEILVFPEAAQISFAARLIDYAQNINGDFANFIRNLAEKYNMLIVAGMFEIASASHVYNTLVITGKGTDIKYQKVHLYDAFGAKESDTVQAGSDYVTIDTVFGKIGFATCYDLRFCEQFRKLGQAGAELLIVSASWGDGPNKSEQWELLIRARASDAQAWLLACNQAWQITDGTAPLGTGNSAVVDPTGKIRASLSSQAGLLISEINLSNVKHIRSRIPIL